jgi:hypothetical protein
MTESASRSELHKQLAHWVARGLIDAGQAAQIEAAETTRPAARPARRSASKAGAARGSRSAASGRSRRWQRLRAPCIAAGG